MKKRTLAEAFRPGQRDMRAVSILHRCIMLTALEDWLRALP